MVLEERPCMGMMIDWSTEQGAVEHLLVLKGTAFLLKGTQL